MVIETESMAQRLYVDHGVTTSVEDKHVWLAVRPEKTILTREKPDEEYNWSAGTVHDIAYLGGFTVFYVRIASGQIVACFMANRERRADYPTWGDAVFVSWEAGSGVVLRS